MAVRSRVSDASSDRRGAARAACRDELKPTYLNLPLAHALTDFHGVLQDHRHELLDEVRLAALGDDPGGRALGIGGHLERQLVLVQVLREAVDRGFLAEQVPQPREDAIGEARVVVHRLLREPSVAAGERHRGGGLALGDLVYHDRDGRASGRDDGHLDVLRAVVDAQHGGGGGRGDAKQRRQGQEPARERARGHGASKSGPAASVRCRFSPHEETHFRSAVAANQSRASTSTRSTRHTEAVTEGFGVNDNRRV